MASWEEFKKGLAEKEAARAAVPTERMRTLIGQGLLFGFGDEAEAALRSMVSDRSYEEIRDELRKSIKAYQEANPGEALALEVAGGLAPSIMSGGAGTLASIMRAGGKFAPAAAKTAIGQGIGQGVLAGAGYSEATNAQDLAKDIALGGATGGVAAPLAGKAVDVVMGAGKGVTNWARERLGKKASDAVQAELRRLAEKSDKSVDEIVQDIAEGRLMIENQTLIHAVKNYVNEGGEAGKTALETVTQRAGERKAASQAAVKQELAPNADENVYKGYMTTADELKAQQGAEYNRVFGLPESQVVSNDLANEMQGVAQRFPSIIDDLNTLYKENNLVPLFTRDEAGAVTLARAPSLSDAEKMYRQIRDLKTKRSMEGGTGLAGSAADAMDRLKQQIDVFSPELKAVRQSYAAREEANKMFEFGSKALSKNPDEIALDIERLSGNPEALAAFKAGVMHSLQRKYANQPISTLRNMATEDKDLNKLITMLTGDAAPAITKQAGIAAEVGDMAAKLPATAGSPTAGLMAEQAASGTGANIAAGTRLVGGDPTAIFDIIGNVLGKKAPGLTADERTQVVNILISDNPETVRKALTDATALNELLYKAEIIANSMGRRTAAQQGAGITSGLFNEPDIVVTKGNEGQ